MNEELRKLLDQFNTTHAAMQASLNQQNEEIRAHGESSATTAATVKSLGETLVAINADLKNLQTNLEEVENRLAGPHARGSDRPKSVGQQFAESEQIKAMRAGSGNTSDIFEVGNLFTPFAALDGTSAGDLVLPGQMPGIVTPPERALRMRDLLNVRPTTSSSIEYIEETGFTNAAAPVAEGALKPESTLVYTRRTAPVEVIAHWVQITRQIIADAPRLQATVDGRMRYGLAVKEEAQFLYGDGLTPNLQGIMTHADVQTYAWSGGTVGDTKIDAFRRAMLLARIAEFPVTGGVLHPNDWADIELMKGDDGHYIWVQVPTGGQMVLWRVPIVETTAINSGEFLTGAFGLGATAWDREETTVRITDSHSDYFIRNKLVLLVEERVGLTIERPEAFVAGTFDAAPAAV